MNTILIILILCVSILLLVWIVKYYDSRLPKNNCNHEMDTIKIFEGKYSNEYLSTCTKCGYQRTHLGKGLNPS